MKDTTLLLTPDCDPIPVLPAVKDLGVLVDDKGNFLAQRAAVVKKVKAKATWVLRSFRTQDMVTLRTLWVSLIRPHQDYVNQLWAPAGVACQLRVKEAPLRAYTKRMLGLRDLHYWDRLIEAKMSSTER